MAEDEFGRFEAMLGAFANILPDKEEQELVGARCARCNGTSFVRVEPVYDAAVSRVVNERSDRDAKHEGGLTDEQIVRRLVPPRRKSPISLSLLVAAILGAGVFFVYRRFGNNLGQLAAMAAVALTAMFLLTRARKLSDTYYAGRAVWKKRYLCRGCGRVIDT